MNIGTGLSESDRETVASGLSRLLADSYTLYLKSHNYHWNVTGPMFRALHLMFEEQYIELRDAVDQVAERIRSLGYPAPGSFSEFTKLTGIPEGDSGIPAMDMVRSLAEGHEACARTARTVLAVTGHEQPLQENEVLQRSIQVRNPYVDPLNLFQIELMRRVRGFQFQRTTWVLRQR